MKERARTIEKHKREYNMKFKNKSGEKYLINKKNNVKLAQRFGVLIYTYSY